jgi:hypothetical protein
VGTVGAAARTAGQVKEDRAVSRQSEYERIRAILLTTRGARPCAICGYEVITQGGQLGARRHREVVHPAPRMDGDTPNRKSGRGTDPGGRDEPALLRH